MFGKEDINKYLQIVKDIRKSYALLDVHVHPFEIIFNNFTYIKNSEHNDIYSIQGTPYVAPELSSFMLEKNSGEQSRQFDKDLRARLSLLTLKQAYGHIGPGVFKDHMNLSGIDKILLLPVLHAQQSDNSKMDLLATMFDNDERFLFGYCIPNSVRNEEITSTIKDAVQKYKIVALKLHPNITGIDPHSRWGKERIERILEASKLTKLPVIIHGGRSPAIQNPEAISYSTLHNLQHIDWSISSEPIIIAHAGMFGHDISEIRNEVLPLLEKLLSKYDHLLVDVSAMTVDELCLILRKVDTHRILFGSDAFYNKQWAAMVQFLYALQRSEMDFEESIIRMVSVNPRKYILKEPAEYV